MEDAAWLDELLAVLGPQGLIRLGEAASAADLQPFERDWRGRYHGRSLAIARPDSVGQVQAVVRACARTGVSIVPQGGNTSLVGGSVPDDTGRQLVLNLQRLHRIRQVDAANLSITVDAGCTLAKVQQAAEDHGLLFPLSLASEGSCTLGGNLASNAGGTQVLRYGTARELCLGLEVVTATGELWSGLTALRKNNMGYDLRDLFIGSEGTLGIITGACLRLYPQPAGLATALACCPSLEAAVALLQGSRSQLDAGLTAFEVMARHPLALVRRHLPAAGRCLDGLLTPSDADATLQPAPWTVLVEYASAESSDHAQSRLQVVLAQALEHGLISDASLAQSDGQRQAMWQLRESIPLAERSEGVMVKHDIAVPTSAVPNLVRQAGEALGQRWPQAEVVCFGHLGDGNLHYNVQPPPACAQGEAWRAFEQDCNQIVFDLTQSLGGSISAEHGIGVLRREELCARMPAPGLAMMRAVKQALDPQGLFNPGCILSAGGAPR